MTPRNTSTGAVLEAMVLPALDRGGYAWRHSALVKIVTLEAFIRLANNQQL